MAHPHLQRQPSSTVTSRRDALLEKYRYTDVFPESLSGRETPLSASFQQGPQESFSNMYISSAVPPSTTMFSQSSLSIHDSTLTRLPRRTSQTSSSSVSSSLPAPDMSNEEFRKAMVRALDQSRKEREKLRLDMFDEVRRRDELIHDLEHRLTKSAHSAGMLTAPQPVMHATTAQHAVPSTPSTAAPRNVNSGNSSSSMSQTVGFQSLSNSSFAPSVSSQPSSAGYPSSFNPQPPSSSVAFSSLYDDRELEKLRDKNTALERTAEKYLAALQQAQQERDQLRDIVERMNAEAVEKDRQFAQLEASSAQRVEQVCAECRQLLEEMHGQYQQALRDKEHVESTRDACNLEIGVLKEKLAESARIIEEVTAENKDLRGYVDAVRDAQAVRQKEAEDKRSSVAVSVEKHYELKCKALEDRVAELILERDRLEVKGQQSDRELAGLRVEKGNMQTEMERLHFRVKELHGRIEKMEPPPQTGNASSSNSEATQANISLLRERVAMLELEKKDLIGEAEALRRKFKTEMGEREREMAALKRDGSFSRASDAMLMTQVRDRDSILQTLNDEVVEAYKIASQVMEMCHAAFLSPEAQSQGEEGPPLARARKGNSIQENMAALRQHLEVLCAFVAERYASHLQQGCEVS